jgi:regulatory protein YycH of two-component signal transduction system YycFG
MEALRPALAKLFEQNIGSETADRAKDSAKEKKKEKVQKWEETSRIQRDARVTKEKKRMSGAEKPIEDIASEKQALEGQTVEENASKELAKEEKAEEKKDVEMVDAQLQKEWDELTSSH